MGRNRDVYIAHREALDNYCGHLLAGLPVNHENITVFYTDFIAFTEKERLDSGIKNNTYLEQ